MPRLVVKAALAGSTFPRRTTFTDAFAPHVLQVERDDLAFKLARSFSLQPNSFRLTYRDDDNDLIELASTSDLREALDYFATDASSSASSSSGWLGEAGEPNRAACITLKLELVVEYDGPPLSDAGSSLYSLGTRERRRSGSNGSHDNYGWRTPGGGGAAGARRARSPASSDTSSDRWILQRAFDGGRAGGDAHTGLDTDAGAGNDDDNWDRRTVSSSSQSFLKPVRDRATIPDEQRIPPPPDPLHDALYPNFARGHFTPANAHPYPPAAPYWNPPPSTSAPDPHAFYPHAPPSAPHLHGYPPLFPPFPLFAPPPPSAGLARFAPTAPPTSFAGSGSSIVWSAGAGADASPTLSQRERARDLFAASSNGDSVRDAHTRDLDQRDAASSNTVKTSSDPDRGNGGEDVPAREDRAKPRRDRLQEETNCSVGGCAETAARYVCASCREHIVNARYTCAVCEEYDLCQKCERLDTPSSSSSSTALTHDASHILLKIPSTTSSSTSISSARAQASALAPSRSPYLSGDVADYWHWWSSWYSTLPHAHPAPPSSSWQMPAARRSCETSPARIVAAPQPLSATAPGLPLPPNTVPVHPSYSLYAYPNHGVACKHCGSAIAGPDAGGTRARPGGGEVGVRWLCANCPTVPSYDLCPACEPLSAHIHEPSHAFLRITHPLRRPLPSVRALLPLLYLPPVPAPLIDQGDVDLHHEAGRPTTDGDSSGNGSVRTRTCSDGSVRRYLHVERSGTVVHERVVCDACSTEIVGTWMRCSHCPTSFDLCAPCLLSGASAQQGHNPSHVFVALKTRVNVYMLSQITRLETRRPRGLLEVDLYA
ncbi:hypothetical protein JCM3770_007165 [Rhodotorula araucariae]